MNYGRDDLQCLAELTELLNGLRDKYEWFAFEGEVGISFIQKDGLPQVPDPWVRVFFAVNEDPPQHLISELRPE